MTFRFVKACRPLRTAFWLLVALSLSSSTPLLADDAPTPWPQWRGPYFNGTQLDATPPLHFSEDHNVRFKVEVPGEGLASPIVYDGVVYLLTSEAASAEDQTASQQAAQAKADAEEWPPSVDPVAQSFQVLAYSADSGELLWRRVASQHVPHESHYLDASWASATPITDGTHLFAHFGSNGTFAYTLDGTLVWKKDLGDMSTRNGFGEGSSPVLWQDLLLIPWDHEGDSFLVALDKSTGEERWRTPRPEERSSWVTPIVVDPDGDGELAPQLVLPGTHRSRGYDPRSGAELWSLGGMTFNTIPSPVARGGVVYLMSGFRDNALQAIDLRRAKGPLEGSDAILFTHDRHTPYVPSPVLYDDNLCFIKHNKNGFTCLDAASGEVRFTEVRLPGVQNVYASPVAAAGRIYVFDKGGAVAVVRNGPTFEVLAENRLDEGVDATPAIYGDSIYVRSRHHLYRLTEMPMTDQPKTDQPKTDQPKTDQPKTDQPKTDQPERSHQR